MKQPGVILSEDNLINAVKTKSREGASALYNMYSKTLYGIILKIVGNKEMSEDVCQETFIRIWSSFDQYDTAKGRLFTWMSCIARNIAKDTLRSRQYYQYINTSPIEMDAEKVELCNYAVFNTDTLSVALWTNDIKKNQKDILDLIYFKGYTHREVADQLKIPLGTVKTRCRKGINLLRSIYRINDTGTKLYPSN